MSVCTGTRVPANTGVPLKRSGDVVIKGSRTAIVISSPPPLGTRPRRIDLAKDTTTPWHPSMPSSLQAGLPEKSLGATDLRGNQGVEVMTDSARYAKIVEWSEEDQ